MTSLICNLKREVSVRISKQLFTYDLNEIPKNFDPLSSQGQSHSSRSLKIFALIHLVTIYIHVKFYSNPSSSLTNMTERNIRDTFDLEGQGHPSGSLNFLSGQRLVVLNIYLRFCNFLKSIF